MALGFLWDLFGYSLVFGEDYGGVIGKRSLQHFVESFNTELVFFLGGYEHFLLIGVDYDKCSKHALYIPAACFALFQMMFATITPLLMTGYKNQLRKK